jgi:hypothetical protein
MRQKFEWSSSGALATLAALLAVAIADPARAGGVPNPDLDSGSRASPCGSPGESCAHISGYIKAGSDFSARHPAQPARAAPPPSLFAGFGAAGQRTADPSSPGTSFMPVSGADATR